MVGATSLLSINNDGSARPVNDNAMMPSGVEASGS